MIRYVNDRIENIEADAIVNAANATGYMGGLLGRFIQFRGVAETIHFITKGEVEKESKRYLKRNKLTEGNVFVTSGGQLGKPILHAITMNKPGKDSHLSIVENCLKNLIRTVNGLGIQKVAIPYLGTGTGRLDVEEVKNLYQLYLQDEQVIYIVSDPFRKR